MNDQEQIYAAVLSRLVNAEIALLAIVASAPRHGIQLLRAIGISAKDFSEDDTRTIFLAIETIGERLEGCPDPIRLAKLIRFGLGAINCWDDEDRRDFVVGSRWSPGAVAALIHRVAFDPVIVRSIAAELREIQQLARDVADALPREMVES